MNQSPLVRWTIGPTNATGLSILKESINNFSQIYPEFERVVCHNNIKLEKIQGLNATLFCQDHSMINFNLRDPDENPEEASGCGWKLCPIRLNPHGHELWIDNDLVVINRISEIDDWLHSNHGIITAGLGRKRMYGCYDDLVPPELHVCAGLFGLPPFYDLESEIISKLPQLKGRLLGGYDEQGLTASVITNMNKYKIIPFSKICILEDLGDYPKGDPDGIHFVGANRKPWHRGWQEYRNRSVKLM